MDIVHTPQRLTLPQQAAVARVAYAVEQPNTFVLVCGPAGVGKTLVLKHVAAARQLHPRKMILTTLASAAAMLADSGPAGQSDMLQPHILLIDDTHMAREGELIELLDRARSTLPTAGLVLAGQGRLLSLVARDSRLEQAVRLRATLPPFTLDESRLLVATMLAATGSLQQRDQVARTIHEIAGGIPALATRLAEVAAVMATANPDRPLLPDDIETIQRRLCLHAA